MIKTLFLQFGRAPGQPAETIQATPVTVFVGPNHSGKSLVLAEIHHYCVTGHRRVTNAIVDRIGFTSLTPEVADDRIRRVTLDPLPTDALAPGELIIGRKGGRTKVPQATLHQSLLNTEANSPYFCQYYLQYHTLMLDGRSRIGLVADQPTGDLLKDPQTSFQVLFQNNASRAEVRRIIHDAFGTYLVVDPTNLSHFRLRLSSVEPESEDVECGIAEASREFHRAALSIDQASDGIKAFTGMITEIVAGDPTVLLIDEPEAFLHPALSYKLGQEIARAGSGSEKRLFVSTHSPNFVMGCIQSRVPVNIVRLTYRDQVATARILASDELLILMRNPLLRSTRVLDALFSEFVVVTESDADRAFYQEVNQRLLDHKPEWGIKNCLFLNAQNKQTVPTILKPLRELGIPAAGIVDVDVLKEGGTPWVNFLRGGFVPALEHDSLGTFRAQIKAKMDATGLDMKRDGGVDVLSDSDREAADNLCETLREYGLFVVRGGELESWLPQLEASSHGPKWLIDVFQKMGEDPSTEGYVRPGVDDVWSFMAEIRQWFSNPKRKGIPS